MTLTVYNTRGLKKANSSTVYDTDQIGTVKAFAGKIVPTNWMVAAGQALLRASYPELYSVIGTTYGAGDGSTTFNLPDLRSKFIYGASDPSGNGALGGEATHLLTSGESGMPAHQTGVARPRIRTTLGFLVVPRRGLATASRAVAATATSRRTTCSRTSPTWRMTIATR